MAGSADDIVIRLVGEDDVSAILAAVEQGLLGIADAADAMNGTLTEAAAAAAAAFRDLEASEVGAGAQMRFIGDAAGLLATAFDDSISSATAFQDWMARIQATLTTMGDAAVRTGDAFGLMDDALSNAAAHFAEFDATVQTVSDQLAAASEVDTSFADAISQTAGVVSREQALLGDLSASLSEVANVGLSATNGQDVLAASATALTDAYNASRLAIDSAITSLDEMASADGAAASAGQAVQDGVVNMAGYLRDAQAGFDNLTASLATFTTTGKLSAEQIATMQQALQDLAAAATEGVDTALASMSEGLNTLSGQGVADMDSLTQSMSDFAAAVDGDAASIQTFAQTLDAGDARMTEAVQIGRTLTEGLTQMRAVLMASSQAFSGLTAVQGDALIRLGALNSAVADFIGITQKQAQTYVEASDAALAYNKVLADAKDAIYVGSQAFASYQTKLAAAGAEMTDFTDVTKQDIADLQAAFRDAQVGVDSYFNTISAKSVQAETDMQAAAARAHELAVYTDEAAASGGRFSGVFSGAGSVIDGLAGQWMNLGMGAGAFDLALKHVVTTGATFQQQMVLDFNLAANAVDQNLGGIGKGFQTMTNYLLSVGPTWGRTPLELSQALYYVMSDGFHGAQALDVLKQAAYATAGGLGDFSTMARSISILMRDYNGGISEAGIKTGQWGMTASQAADLVIKAVTNGSTTIEDFAANLGKVAPIAAESHYSAEQLAIAWDVFTRAGVSSAQTSTYLRSTMMQLGDHEQHVAEAAQGMGINISASTLEMIKQTGGSNALALQLQYMIQQIDAAAKSHGDLASQAAWANGALLTLTGGIRSGMGAALLASGDFTNLNDVLLGFNNQTKNNVGALQHFNQMNKSVSFQIMVLKASLQAAYDQFVITYGPQIAALINRVAGFLIHITSIMKTNPNGLGKALLAIGVLLNGGFLASLLALGLRFSGLTDVLKTLGGAAAEIGSGHGLVGLFRMFSGGDLAKGAKDAEGLGTALGHLGARMQAPLAEGQKFIPVLGGSGILGSMQKLGSYAGQFGAMFGDALIHPFRTFGQVLPVVGGAAGTAFGHIIMGARTAGGVLGNFKDLALTAFKNPMGALGMLRDAISGGFMGAIRGLGSAISGGIPLLFSLGGSFMALAAPILLIAGIIAIVVLAFVKFRSQTMAALQPLVAEFRNVFQAIAQLVGLAIQNIVSTWRQMWPQIQPAMLALLNAVKQMGPVWQVLGTIIKVVAAIVIGAIQALAGAFIRALPFVINFVTGVIQFLTHLAQIVQAIFTGQWGKLPGLIGAIFMDILHLIGSAAGAILSFVGNLISGVLNWFGRILGAQNPVVQLVHAIINFFTNLWHTIVGGSIVPDLVNGVVSWFAQLPGRVLGIIASFVGSMISHFTAMAGQVVSSVVSMGGRVVSAITGAMGSAVGAVAGGAGNIIGRFSSMAGSIIGNMGSLAGSVVSHATSMMGSFLGAVTGGIGNILGQFGGLVGRISGAMSGLPGALAGIAANAMGAMAGAIRGAVGNLASAAGNVVGGIISGAKGMLGIHSPSRVFLEIGTNTMEGMRLGIVGHQGALVSGTQQTLGAVVAAARGTRIPSGPGGGALMGGGGGLSGGGPTTQTIHLHLDGGLGAGLQLLNPSDRRRFALQVAQELSQDTQLQGIMPVGYSGRGTI